MKWILIFWLMMPPFVSHEVGSYADKDQCLYKGEQFYEELTPVDQKGWDWFCVSSETLEVVGGKTR